MSNVLNFIKSLPKVEDQDEETGPIGDIHYIRKSSSLINDALQKGHDVLQTIDGDIVITEVKTITYRYHWNEEKSKFERITSGNRSQKRKMLKKD